MTIAFVVLVSLCGLAGGALMAVIEHRRFLSASREALASKESSMLLREQSLEERYAERERMWAEERRVLLDRIQDPHAVAMARIESEVQSTTETDLEIDKQYASSPSGAVQWDPDLELAAELGGDE